jgi:hypothetical protein
VDEIYSTTIGTGIKMIFNLTRATIDQINNSEPAQLYQSAARLVNNYFHKAVRPMFI